MVVVGGEVLRAPFQERADRGEVVQRVGQEHLAGKGMAPGILRQFRAGAFMPQQPAADVVEKAFQSGPPYRSR